MKTLLAIPAALAAAFALLPGPAHADAPTLVCPTTVVAGTPLVCTLTGVEANAGRKVTYTNPITHSKINVANYTVIPATVNPDGTVTLTYTPGVSETGRTEVLSNPFDCVRLGCRQAVAASFTVTTP